MIKSTYEPKPTERFGNFGLTPDEIRAANARHRGDFAYLWPVEARLLLADAETRWVEHVNSSGFTWRSPEVFVDGKWYGLARTDLADDVRTSGLVGLTPDRGSIAQVLRLCDYGARVTEDTIFVIDSYSDG